MKIENVILAYKLNNEQIGILNKVAKEINKNITIQLTDVWQDIVAVPCFIVFVDLQYEDKNIKEKILQCIKDMEQWQEINIINSNSFKDIELLREYITKTYYNYNKKE